MLIFAITLIIISSLSTMAGVNGFSRHRFSILGAVYSTHAKLDTVPSSENLKSKINYNAK